MATPSFQDLLEDFSDENFVGRAEQLALFEKAITATRPPFLILDVSGQGGVGKTTLLEQFRHVARRHEAFASLVNEDQLTVPAVLAEVVKQFTEAGYPFKTFEERNHKYRELKEQVEADQQAPTGALDFALRSVTKIGLRSLKRVPLAGEVTEVLLTPESEMAIADNVSAFATYVARKFTNKDERVLLLETEAVLTRCFLEALNKHAEECCIALIFDAYEKTASLLERWLVSLLAGEYGKVSGNARLVIAGRYPLGQAWTRFRKAIRQVELCEFTEAEAREYLTRAGITAEDQITSLLALSNRLPVLLALLVSAPGAVSLSVTGDAVERFLQGATPEQCEAALTASVPRFFNQDILAVILGAEPARAAFTWLSEAHFVRATSLGWVYHDVVRTLMLRHFHLRSPKQYAETHAKLAADYQRQAAAPSLAPERQFLHEGWWQKEQERIYHSVSLAPLQNFVEVLRPLLRMGDRLSSLIGQSPLAGDEKRVCQDIFISSAAILNQTAQETTESVLLDWSKRFANFGVLFSKSKRRETASRLHQCLVSLGALENLEPALRSRALSLAGFTQYDSDNYRGALADFTQAIELQPEGGDNYYWRGLTYHDMKDYMAALADFNKAIELQPEDGDNYYWRGRTHHEMKHYAATLADFTRAIGLQPEDGYNYQWRGSTHHEMKLYAAALADFTRAIDLQPEEYYNYQWRGSTHLEMQDYAAALADFTKAIDLQPEDGDNYYWRGRTYREMKDCTAALADFGKAIDLQPENGHYYYGRGRTYYDIRDYAAALTDFGKAIDLQPENGYHYYWRGRTYYDMRDYAAALADFGKAIDLQSEDVYNFAWLGRVHLALGQFSNAQTAFAKAEDFLGNRGTVAYIIAGGYALVRQPTEACDWLRRAYHLDKDSVKSLPTDSNFDLIRQTPEFQALLKEFDETSSVSEAQPPAAS